MRFFNWLDEWLITEGIQDLGIFKACFLSGNPGAGKSFVISKIASGQVWPRVVNTDKALEWFMKKDPENTWQKYGDKTKSITKELLAHYLNSLLPLWIDGTSSNPTAVMRRKGILESIGYDVSMVFVSTSLETSLERNRQRQRQVDEDFLKETYEQMNKLKPYYSSQFSPFVQVNNNVGELTDEVVISAYKKMDSFFKSPLKNPIGISLRDELLRSGGKYLIEHPDYEQSYINKLISSWYRR